MTTWQQYFNSLFPRDLEKQFSNLSYWLVSTDLILLQVQTTSKRVGVEVGVGSVGGDLGDALYRQSMLQQNDQPNDTVLYA